MSKPSIEIINYNAIERPVEVIRYIRTQWGKICINNYDGNMIFVSFSDRSERHLLQDWQGELGINIAAEHSHIEETYDLVYSIISALVARRFVSGFELQRRILRELTLKVNIDREHSDSFEI